LAWFMLTFCSCSTSERRELGVSRRWVDYLSQADFEVV
jgi:hypothetical protein